MGGRILRRLNKSGRDLVDDSFLESRSGSLTVGDRHIEDIDESVDLSLFNDVVDKYIEEYSPNDESMDEPMSIDLHKNLDLSRRVAGDKGVWAYLAAIERPDFLRHRWQNDGSVTRTRVTRMRRNVFSRLWWMAELTEEDGDYSLTESFWECDGPQDLLGAIFERNLSHHQPAVRALILELRDEDRDTIRSVAKKLSQASTTIVLESMAESEIKNVIESFADRVKDLNYAA